MTEPSRSPAGAGFTLLGTVLLFTGIGVAIGLLVGAPVPFSLGGVFIGFAVGFRLVYARFKDL